MNKRCAIQPTVFALAGLSILLMSACKDASSSDELGAGDAVDTIGNPVPVAEQNTPRHSQLDEVQQQLDTLKSRPSGFLIVQLDPTNALIQFTRSLDEQSYADLPLQWLTIEQEAVARKIFIDAGATEDDLATRDTADRFPSLQVQLTNDMKTGVELTARLLSEVYQLPPDTEISFATEED